MLDRHSPRYRLGPTKTCIALLLALLTLNPTTAASTPILSSADARAFAASCSSDLDAGSRWISTFLAATCPASGRISRRITDAPRIGVNHPIWRQPASSNIASTSHKQSACSPSDTLVAVSNCVPANSLSFSTSDSQLSRRTSLRGVLNFVSANLASAARAFASAIFSSDSRLASQAATMVSRIATYSMINPTAMRQFATREKNLSLGSFASNAKKNQISRTIPARMISVPHPETRSSVSSLW
jgi:hypothetical protein